MVLFGPFLWWTVAFDAKRLVTLHVHLNLVDECISMCAYVHEYVDAVETLFSLYFSQAMKYAAVAVVNVDAVVALRYNF